MDREGYIYLGVILLSLIIIFYSVGSYLMSDSGREYFQASWRSDHFEQLSDYENFTTLEAVFSGNGPNCSVGFIMSDGYHRPGDRVGVVLYVYRPKYYRYNLVFIVKLFRIETGGYLIQLDNKTIDVSGTDKVAGFIGEVYFSLPMSEGVKYLLVVEALENGTVIDMIRSIIIVPIQVMNARLTLDKKVYAPGDTLTYTIVNIGGEPVMIGYCYEIYRWTGESWVLDDKLTPDICILVGILLKPGGRWSNTITLDDAKPGLYKIVVEVRGETTNKVKKLSQEFIIEA